MRTSMAVASATLFLSLSGCQLFNPEPPNYQSIEYVRERLDASDYEAAPMPEHLRWWQDMLWYVPNLLLDIPDIVKVNVGLGLGQGIEISITEHAQMYWRNYRRWGLGLDGRALGVFEDGRFREGRFFKWKRDTRAGGLKPIFALPNLRPYEYPDQQGVAAVQEVPANPWEIGVLLHLIAGAEVRVRPYEIYDLVSALWGEDPAEDDHGLRAYPIHDYPVQGNVMDMFVAAVDQLNEADLNAVLSRELAATARVARGGVLKPLDTSGAASTPGGGGDDDILSVGEALIYPAHYRSGGGGRLEASHECRQCILRWGVPAQITYDLRLFDQRIQRQALFRVTLEHEDGQWKIIRIKDMQYLPSGRVIRSMRWPCAAFAIAPLLCACTGFVNNEWSVLPPEEARRPPAVIDANQKLLDATQSGDVTIVTLFDDLKRSTTVLVRCHGKIPAHFHARSAETLYVLQGGGDFLLDKTWQKVRAGMLIHVPIGVPHAFVNRDANGTLLLCTYAPGFLEGDRTWLEEGSPANTP